MRLRPLKERHAASRKMWKSPLAREIAIALAIKGALLFGLWYAFFSHPLDDKLTADQVGAALLERHPAAPTP